MADELKTALIKSGHRVREYCPVGELVPGMAYLVRRLLENTSNEGFLRAKAGGQVSTETLLRNPVDLLGATVSAPIQPPAKGVFKNAPNTDFALSANRDRMRLALKTISGQLGKKHPLIIGGKKIIDRELIASVNPAKPSQIVGHWARATVADADQASRRGIRLKAFPAWAATPVETRAQILEKAADLMEERRFELNALEVFEAAKPWIRGADGDISEAIDFCRFYAVKMRELDKPKPTQVTAGERCVQRWTPRGVAVAIAPWKYP